MKNTNIIIKNTVNLAKELNACAIIVFGDIPIEGTDTSIPIYSISKKPKDFIKYLISSSLEKTKENTDLSSQLVQECSGKIEHLEKVTAIEHFMGKIRDGIVIGIIETFDSTSIIIHNIKENPMLKMMRECEERASTDVLRAVLSIALEISTFGREGKKVGTAFIIGDVEEVMIRSHQIIINPYYGHPEDRRNILNRDNWESIKEFSQLDGVFVISEDGIIHSAGRYLDIDAREITIDKGLGGRHVSAATITRDTVAIAVTISESGGVIRVYMDGKKKFSIETSERAIEMNRS